MNAEDLRSIATHGGGMIIDASQYTTAELSSIATAAQATGAPIILKNAHTKSAADLKSIAMHGMGKVMFDLA